MNDKPSIYFVLLSRKFWAAIIGLVLILVTTWGQDPYPVDAVVTAIMGVVGAYMAAVAWEDGKQTEAAGRMAAADTAATTTTVTTPSENVVVSTSDSKPL